MKICAVGCQWGKFFHSPGHRFIIKLMLVWHLFRHFILSRRAGALIKRISFLSVVGIGISVTAFLIVLFVMNGMNASIRKRILGLEPHLYVTVAGAKSAAYLESHPVFQKIKHDEKARAYAYETQDVIVRSQDGQFRGGIARGVTKESLQYFNDQLKKMQLRSSHQDSAANFWDVDEVPAESEIFMGVDLAQSLGVFEGDYVTVVAPSGLLLPPSETPKFERVKIKRIITTSLSDVDAKFIFYQRGKALNSLISEGLRSLGIEVWLDLKESVDQYKAELIKFNDVGIETWQDRNSALLYALKLEKLTIGTFLGLAGMIAASSILTVLALLLSQKRRDIAVLRTIGFSARQIVNTFTKMGFILSFIGVTAGLLIGLGAGLYLESHPLQLAESHIYYDPTLPALVDYKLFFFVIAISAFICWLGSYIPSRTAAEVEPSDALRLK